MFFQSSKIKKLQMEMIKEKQTLHYSERNVITWFHQQTENFRMPEVTQEKQIQILTSCLSLQFWN